jgi:MFS family permease
MAAGYLVAFAVLLVTGARLGSTYGQRRVFLVGLLAFTVASLAAGLAPGLGWLLLARVAQGASAALVVPQVLSGIQLHFAGPDRVRALGYYAIALSGGAVVGQVLGGLLISADLFGTGWRPIFLINVPLGVGLLLAGRRLLPETPRRPGGLDWPGVGALSAAVLLLVVPLVLGPDRRWPVWAWPCLAASAPALLGFAVLQRRVAAGGGRPLVAPALWRYRQVRLGLLAGVISTNAQLSGALGVAVASTGYLAARAGLAPAGAFGVVLVGFMVLAVLASVAAAGAGTPRPVPEPASSTAR